MHKDSLVLLKLFIVLDNYNVWSPVQVKLYLYEHYICN